MKEKIRIFVCDKCCNTAYTTDGSIPGACTSQYWVRTSGICGGHYSEIEGADFSWVVNQEVEKRMAERMLTDETISHEATERYKDKVTGYRRSDLWTAFKRGAKWYRSRLTQKTEGGIE